MNVISKDVVLAKNTPIGRTELTEEVQERKARNKPRNFNRKCERNPSKIDLELINSFDLSYLSPENQVKLRNLLLE